MIEEWYVAIDSGSDVSSQKEPTGGAPITFSADQDYSGGTSRYRGDSVDDHISTLWFRGGKFSYEIPVDAGVVAVELQIVPGGSGEELEAPGSSRIFKVSVEGYEKEIEYSKTAYSNLQNLIFTDVRVLDGVLTLDFDFYSSEMGLASVLVFSINKRNLPPTDVYSWVDKSE